jgi:hypothetical protein
MGIHYFKPLNILLTILAAMWYTEHKRFGALDFKALISRFKIENVIIS